MPDLKDALKKLCNETNTVKETYYGSSHRASFSLNGEKAEWDILHIGIPFSPQKESELMRRFGFDRDDLPSFYGCFEKAVVRHISLMKALNDSGMPGILKSVAEYRSVQYYPRMNKEGKQIGQDFYLISRPMEAFVGSDIITQQGAHLQDINNLAIRLLQTAKTFSENGFSLGAIDLDSCFYASEGPDKKYLKLAYSFYGTGPGISPDTYTDDVRAFIPEAVAGAEEQQGLDSDVRTICAYIWTMLDGKHYTEPNLNAWIARKYYFTSPQSVPADMLPRYAPIELSSLLVEGMTRGADAMRLLQNDIRQLNKRIVSGEIANTFIPFEAPSYLQRPLPDLREEHEEEEELDNSGESGDLEEAKQPYTKKKPKLVGLIIAAISSLILCTAVLLLFGGDAIHNLLFPVQNSFSSADNIYAADGRVVNDKLKVYSEYSLDEYGNIVKASEPGSILYPEEYVSDYVYVENIRLAIVEKHFSGIWNGTAAAPELREEVIDLRGVPDLYYSYAADSVNEISESVIQKYGIKDDSLILLNNDPEDPESFAVVMFVDMSGSTNDWECEEKDAFEGPSVEENDDPECPVQEIQAISDSLLYKTRGEWRYKVQVSLDPADAVNSRIQLTSEDPDHMIFIVEDETGREIKAKSIKMNAEENTEVSFYVSGNTEGKYLIRAESEDGTVSKKIQMTFLPPSSYAVETPPPRPTPIPIDALDPVPTLEAQPEQTPMPVSTPRQEEYNPVGYPDSFDWGNPAPVTAVNPIETNPDPTPAPVYTPEPQIPLSCMIDRVELTVGGTFRLGDYLEGIEGGYLTAVSSPDGVVSINQADGFLLTGLTPGSCTVSLSKGTESISVSITVV